MNQNLKTSIVALAVAGGGIIGVGTLASASYGGEPPTTELPTSDGADTPAVNGLQAAPTVDETDGTVDQNGEGHGHRGPDPEVVAEALGITTDQLHEARDAGQSLADIATAQGVSIDTVIAAIVDDAQAHIADQVASGDLTQEQADELLADLEARVTERVNQAPGADRPERGPEGARGPRGNQEAIAAALGITTDELHAACEAGQSLADIAAAQGVNIDDVVSVIVDDIEAHLTDEVASGDITQEQADQRLANAEARVTERVNEAPGEHGPRGPRPEGDQPAPAEQGS